ncbi:MAG TPA: co-chaperone GroES [Miltoncostaeaceae bacterium]|nr:co-chaperone GroES [Miltoncostaeaceae bacterium]
MKLKPLGDRLVVKAIEPEEKTASGIYLPDQAKERPQRGNVIAVGPGRYEDGKRVPMQVAEGDEVVYARYGGTEIRLDGEEYIILRETDVLAKAE